MPANHIRSILIVLVIMAMALLSSGSPLACTVMRLKLGDQWIVARNHDWVSGGGLVIFNPRGISKQAISPNQPLRWTSLYGSVSMNQFGREIPFAGMNEKGLTVDLLQLRDTQFPDRSDPRSSVNAIQWVQYQLDCAATVEEVIASLDEVRPQPFIEVLEKVHYFVTDPSGDAAIIEYLDGEAIVQHDPASACVLANSTWKESRRAIQQNDPRGNSETRVTLANRLVGDAANLDEDTSPIDYAFDALHRVRQPTTTQWSLVYEPAQKRITFHTRMNEQRRWIDLDELSLDKACPVVCVDINSPHSGNLAEHLRPLSTEDNRRIVDEAFDAIVPPSFLRSAVKGLVVQYGESLEALPQDTLSKSTP
ncbi:linear amide C-N hydrolase [Neorhodopirellula pilleata]|uniref:Choloylglycine hydrolase/NAAA C-terminal domain-containing protein n=1 Tax=Neorhodopirellula pilleata TaxID=2714738 RepID=A0A5C6AYA2_9BACT|nr:linear amide C-N hydrolase [Neorhodopirellula pilleata]TWU04129.1 hypothetical protein Pla100_10660 [Neorhodopirellula pilleata]